MAATIKLHELLEDVRKKLKCDVDINTKRLGGKLGNISQGVTTRKCGKPAYRAYWVDNGLSGKQRHVHFHIECLKHFQDKKEWDDDL